MNRAWLTVSFGVLTLTGSAAAQQAEGLDRLLPVDSLVKVGTLDNGLRYYIRENTRPENRAELRLVVNAGSVLEDEDQLGLAHFVEHMAFNGTENFPRQELVDYLERIGMRFGPDLNAYTSFDETVYMLQVPTDSVAVLQQAFQILEEWAHRQIFDSAMVDGERGVVIEEWRLGRGAEARMFDRQFPVLFQGSRYAERLPIGKKETLESFDHAALRRFYEDWYRPELMGVVAVGDFDAEAIEDLIRKHFAGLTSPGAAPERTVFPVPDHDTTLIAVAADKEATESLVSIYYKQPRRSSATIGAYRQLIVERLYNGMLNARLFELTQQADPPVLWASSGQGRLIRSKEVYVLGAGVAEGGIERGLAAVLTEAERVARHGFTPSELERHKAELARRMEQVYAERDKTNSNAYAFEYVSAFLDDEPIPGVRYEYELHERFLPEIRLEEVNRLAREWLADRNRVILVNAPDKEDLTTPSQEALLAAFATVEASEIAPYEDRVDDAPLLAAKPEPGEIVSEEVYEGIGVTAWELANGVRVLLKPTDFKDDQVLFRASSPGGTSIVADADYIAAATASTVVSAGGLNGFSQVELNKKLAGKVVNVQPSIGELYEGLGGSASPEDLETLFELIYLRFTAPRRDSVAYLAFRQQVEAILTNRKLSPIDAFQDTVTVTLTQHHPRARPPTLEVYGEMDLERSYAIYQDRFGDAGDFTFVFVGNLDVEAVRPLVERYLATLPSGGRVESWRDVGMRPPTGVVERVVRRGMEPSSQTRIIFTGPFEYTRENRYLIRSLTEILEIRLRERLREDLSGTYGASVGGAPEREPVPAYSIQVRFGADPERLEELVSVVFEEIQGLKTEGPTEDELAKIKEAQRRTRETSLKQNDFWLTQLLLADRLGSDPRDILTYEPLIDALEGEMIREAARRYLPEDNYVRVSLYPETR